MMGCLHLQDAFAELDREREGLLTRYNGAVGVSRLPEHPGRLGQHLS